MKIIDKNDELSEENVELFIENAIKKLGNRNFIDAMFWRSCINILLKKYKIDKQYFNNVNK